ncbi:hypothetical protein ABZ863_11365 [Saccharomonospora sp. NPDC046836]|uniref:hypothetical protein n=1 Tax=Saccharomonospora sp. NPDC046836 TaxID=3156921 RepID=UPI0033F03A9D
MGSSPTPQQFTALARSSPWRWRTLRFTVSWRLPDWGFPAVRAWVRRPDGLRVETLDGELLDANGASRRQVHSSSVSSPRWSTMADRPGRRPCGRRRRTPRAARAVRCCSPASGEDKEASGGGPLLRERDPGLRYADAYLVRLDVATGVCVYAEELGGSRAGAGHDVTIEAVGERLPDEFFTQQIPPRS